MPRIRTTQAELRSAFCRSKFVAFEGLKLLILTEGSDTPKTFWGEAGQTDKSSILCNPGEKEYFCRMKGPEPCPTQQETKHS